MTAHMINVSVLRELHTDDNPLQPTILRSILSLVGQMKRRDGTEKLIIQGKTDKK